MSFDAITLAAIIDELTATVLDGRVQRVVRPTMLSIALEVYNHGRRHQLLLSAHPQFARAHLLNARPSRGIEGDSPLLLLLRKYVVGGRITAIEQPDLERVLLISIVKGPQTRNTDDSELSDEGEPISEVLRSELVVEVMERRSNIVLVGDDNIVKESVRHVTPSMSRRPIQPREPYELPPRQDKRDPRRMTAEGLASLASKTTETDFARALVATYAALSPQLAREAVFRVLGATKVAPSAELPFAEIATTITNLLHGPWQPSLAIDEDGPPRAFAPYQLTQFANAQRQPSVSVAIEQFYAPRERLTSHAQRRDALAEALRETHDRFERQGIQLAEQMRQAESLEQLRWEGEMIFAFLHAVRPGQTQLDVEGRTIELNPAQTAVENAQARFKAYDKAKGAIANVPELLAATEARIAGINETLALLALADSFEQIEDIAREAEEQGYIRAQTNRKRQRVRRQPPLRVAASDGTTMYIGRSAGQNDYATFTLAAPDDLWLHARGIPGAHVIIKSSGSEISEAALQEAASYAAYYSIARDDAAVDVEIARRRMVKRIPGGVLGLVTYQAERTIRAAPRRPS